MSPMLRLNLLAVQMLDIALDVTLIVVKGSLCCPDLPCELHKTVNLAVPAASACFQVQTSPLQGPPQPWRHA